MRQEAVSFDEFGAFYAAHKDRCLRAAIASGVDPARAEDAVAEAFSRAWARWRTVRSARSPAAWVVRTAVNADISWWRKRRHEVGPPQDVRSDQPDLDGSLAQIRTRGDRLRRRRTSLLIAAATTACLVVTGLLLTISGRGPLAVDVSPADQSPGPRPPDQVLTWTGKPTNVTGTELATMKVKCLAGAQQDAAANAGTSPEMPGSIDPDRLHPIFAERRTDFGPEHENVVRAMFLTDDYLVHCSVHTTDSSQPRAEDAVGSADRIKAHPDMGPWQHFSSSWTTNWIGFMLPVPDEAASVKFFIDDGYVDGAINSGIAVAWFSAEGVQKRQDSVGVAVYDAAGRRIDGEDGPVPSKAWPVD